MIHNNEKKDKAFLLSANDTRERVFLIGLHNKDTKKDDYLESMEELRLLSKTAEFVHVDSFVQMLDKANPATWIGKGKLQEIVDEAKKQNVKTLIFNDNLSPAQTRNITNISKCRIIDRTELILDIFSQHAKTREAKIQVEVAQLEYSYSKLKNMWEHFSRIDGGMIGARGPGEKQLEKDRRLIKGRIAQLKKKLDDIRKHTEVKRKRRDDILSISLVGYTNAGKSTLFNKLTNAQIYTADKLFATLDATTRVVKNKNNEKILITDTIGFINELPPLLIQSFYSTLYEVLEADLLLHVVDASSARLYELIESVDAVLKDINAADKNILLVFNKWDLCNSLTSLFLKKQLKEKYPDSVFISAKTGLNIDTLYEKINYYLKKRKMLVNYKIPMENVALINFLHQNGTVTEIEYNESNNEYDIALEIDYKYIEHIERQLHDYSIQKYINS
ncbi:MAG: GTPase HflX [Candidatus Cloacimonetes bacterium]|nr:GTPase HflX [Candidatus Cloacimonadota bacterium]MDD2649591.1 GTPase HflX [Candidatus Cloacimonadota bacterium]MDD3502165.1 GTPase HflX [Candidatus Cloacimonadota bacterium]